MAALHFPHPRLPHLAIPHVPRVTLPHIPPMWREGRFGIELAALHRSPVYRLAGVPPGAGRPVMPTPGSLAAAGSLGPLTHWRREGGYRTRRAGIRANVA